ncbi:hypothetical protein B5F82_02060 [Megamonas hypermegale]|uniref:helix-turn-helix domain-containing protein n=1 Tax=Megamonas hypermegale TaxID=158847 RepID=UPI000B3B063E|nr:helix-turn-helix transcriptional regulator [Megamonas hypermegale]OUO41173.1 hypothetical protein B5F82_02060 [Megamonas hypermegale]
MEHKDLKISNIDDYINDIEKEFTLEEKKYTKLRNSFLKDLYKLRKEKNLTQKDLEKMTAIKQSTIAKIEKGRINPSLNNILKLVIAMGKTIKIEEENKNN